MKRFHGIYWQHFGLTAGMVLLTLLLLGTSFFTLTYTYIMRENQNQLVEKAELLHVIPSSYPVEEALKLSGTRVLMKAGKKMGQVKAQLEALSADVCMIENCGMENEKIYRSAEEIPEDAGYYSLILVKEKAEQ